MDSLRRDFVRLAAASLGVSALAPVGTVGAYGQTNGDHGKPAQGLDSGFNVRRFGTVGDGKTLDTAAVNAAIQAAAAAGGGTVLFPAGVYACYSIHLASGVYLHLDAGATILAASTPDEGTQHGYDAAESNAPWEEFQDYGHNHWHNSLLWGENLHDFGIVGPGLIWGKGLSRGDRKHLPFAESPGVGNKAIALKNCRNVILRDFSILQGGHFGILATGVDNLTIDNLKIDSNRDGMDLDCCRNVRISNCSVNSPWDDGICPKSSFALGYARATENVTIANCYVTGDYELGTLLDGTFKRFAPGSGVVPTGRIKCGTESNGGFKNIAISNCVFESCRGFALETVDGAVLEDISFVGITMRDVRNSPIFLRLGARMRGPKGTPVGSLKRVLMSNIVSYGAAADLPSNISGIAGHPVEDIQVSDVYLHHRGGGTAEMAERVPPEQDATYPEPNMFGILPAQGFFIRHAKNVDFSKVEIAREAADARPLFWLDDVAGADFFNVKVNGPGERPPLFALKDVKDFRLFGTRGAAAVSRDAVDRLTL